MAADVAVDSVHNGPVKAGFYGLVHIDQIPRDIQALVTFNDSNAIIGLGDVLWHNGFANSFSDSIDDGVDFIEVGAGKFWIALTLQFEEGIGGLIFWIMVQVDIGDFLVCRRLNQDVLLFANIFATKPGSLHIVIDDDVVGFTTQEVVH